MKKWAVVFLLVMNSSFAAKKNIELFFTDTQKSAGFILVEETRFGLLFTPSLTGLTPGMHGFHVHDHPACGNKAMDAMGHLDPATTKQHRGPYQEDGHLGDLPSLFVDAEGQASLPVLASRLQSIRILKKHTLMVHADPDNYSDYPAKLGGSGARVLCAVIS